MEKLKHLLMLIWALPYIVLYIGKGLRAFYQLKRRYVKAESFFAADMAQLLKLIQRSKVKKAKALLEQGGSLNTHGEKGLTPLYWLIKRKDVAAVELALQLGADPNLPAMTEGDRHGPWPEQPLAAVAGRGKTKLLKRLLEYGADPDSTNYLQKPAIFCAIERGNWEHLNILLENGADVNATDGTNTNSALYAANIMKYDFAYKLVSLGAQADMPATTGATLVWRVHSMFEKNAKNPGFRLSEDMIKTKELLLEKGFTFPPLSPKEVRERRAAGELLNP